MSSRPSSAAALPPQEDKEGSYRLSAGSQLKGHWCINGGTRSLAYIIIGLAVPTRFTVNLIMSCL